MSNDTLAIRFAYFYYIVSLPSEIGERRISMGTVHLTNGHHGLCIREKEIDLSRRVLLTPELLARPIVTFGRSPRLLNEINQKTIRNALQGLMDLRGFNAAVSHDALEVNGVLHIASPHREWGEITLGTPENVIVGFSHDSRHHNKPFYNILEWLEEDYPNGKLSDEEFAQFVESWTNERWRNFFEGRIWSAIDKMRSEAAELRNQAGNLTLRAETAVAVLDD